MDETTALSPVPADGLTADDLALLCAWYRTARRDLPWRADRDCYHVWLSEIMLQQTRVEAVKGYYARFLAAVPDIASLAAAPIEQLNKLWEGLGYYSRVRNLKCAAQQIMDCHGGVFPQTYAEIRALKGIGDYTAGAVASICFDLPESAVDGNVLRVWARFAGDGRCTDDPAVRRDIRRRLNALYAALPARSGQCGTLTQALMELGAIVCLPNGTPLCGSCPLSGRCRSADGRWRSLPVRAAKKGRRDEELTVFVLRCGSRFALCRRPDDGLLAGLWQFPNVPGYLDENSAIAYAERWGVRPLAPERMRERTHIFTHITWHMRCYDISCAHEAKGFTWADTAELDGKYALPTAFRMFREGPEDAG